MAEHYDTIVIGAGLSGLSIAAILSSEEGKKVAVLEKENYLGGRLRGLTLRRCHDREELCRKSLADVPPMTWDPMAYLKTTNPHHFL
jgi:cation diffusion facilitator CzcD-associated flavoprotein CzcO